MDLCYYRLSLVVVCGPSLWWLLLLWSMGSRAPSFNNCGSWASQAAQTVRNLPTMQGPGFSPRVGKIPWRRAQQPTLVCLPGESPWTEEPGGLQPKGSQRVGLGWAAERSTKHMGFVTHRLSRSVACGMFLDQESNPCLLHWQVDS